MPSKYSRKIIPMGKISKGIILPIGWIRYFNLKEGDKIKIIEKKNELIIKP